MSNDNYYKFVTFMWLVCFSASMVGVILSLVPPQHYSDTIYNGVWIVVSMIGLFFAKWQSRS